MRTRWHRWLLSAGGLAIPRILVLAVAAWLLGCSVGHAAIYGTVSGLVDDPQLRPVPDADVTLRARLSSWREHARTDVEGRFSFATVPAGEYTVSIAKQ